MPELKTVSFSASGFLTEWILESENLLLQRVKGNMARGIVFGRGDHIWLDGVEMVVSAIRVVGHYGFAYTLVKPGEPLPEKRDVDA